MTATTDAGVRLYEGDADNLIKSDLFPDRVSLLPAAGGRIEPGERIRIMWGQDMLRDLLDGRYRSVVCGVNDRDNSHGIIAQLCSLVPTSQWTAATITAYARTFQDSVNVLAAGDREPYILKFDLDQLLIFGVLRPRAREYFTIEDVERGFGTVAKMLRGRRERLPVASVSFINARANRLLGPDGREPSFEAVLSAMYRAGFRGDVYPAPSMWKVAHVGVFSSYPFPESVERMRAGGF
jgi:hypothetical protein